MGSVNKTEVITIGEHQLPVVPQRHAYLRNKLSAADFENIMSENYAAESYRLLSILIPELPNVIPIHEWEGFGSREQMEAGEYSEELDKSPTTAEIVNAFKTAFLVSGADELGKIVDLVQTGVAVQGSMQSQTPTAT